MSDALPGCTRANGLTHNVVQGKFDFFSQRPAGYCPDESVMKMLRDNLLLAKMDMDALYPPAKLAVGQLPLALPNELASKLIVGLLSGQSSSRLTIIQRSKPSLQIAIIP